MSTIITRAAEPEPAVGPGAGRRLHLGHARAVRHPLAVVRRRLLPADRHDRADLRRRPGPLVGGAAAPAIAQESDVSAGTLFSSGLIAGGSIAGILFAVLVGTGMHRAPLQTLGATVLIPFAARRGWSGNCRRRPALPGARRDRGPRGDAQSGMTRRIDGVKPTRSACTRCHPGRALRRRPRRPEQRRAGSRPSTRCGSFPATSICRTCSCTASSPRPAGASRSAADDTEIRVQLDGKRDDVERARSKSAGSSSTSAGSNPATRAPATSPKAARRPRAGRARARSCCCR